MLRMLKNKLDGRILERENHIAFEHFIDMAKRADQIILCNLKPRFLTPVESLEDYPLYKAAAIIEEDFDRISENYGLTIIEVNHQLYIKKGDEMHYFDICAGTGTFKVLMDYADAELSCHLSENMVGKLEYMNQF